MDNSLLVFKLNIMFCHSLILGGASIICTLPVDSGFQKLRGLPYPCVLLSLNNQAFVTMTPATSDTVLLKYVLMSNSLYVFQTRVTVHLGLLKKEPLVLRK
jgi:hypothetical protein